MKKINWGEIFACVFMCTIILAVIVVSIYAIFFAPDVPKHTHNLEIVAVNTAEHTHGTMFFGFGGVSGNGKVVFYLKTNDDNNSEIYAYEKKLKDCVFALSDSSYVKYKCFDQNCDGKLKRKNIEKDFLSDTIYVTRDLLSRE